MANLPDNVYMDILVSNFQSSTVKPTPFSYTDNRSIAFLDNPSEYELSILRFAVVCTSAPSFIPSIEPNQPDVNRTIYSITMTYPVKGQDVVHQEYLSFTAQDKSAAVPAAPSQTWNKQADMSTGYYNVYNYEFLIYNINLCMTACFNNLKSKVLAVNPAAIFPPQKPFMTWDTVQNISVITAESKYFDESPENTNPIIRVYFNAPMYNLFSSFPMEFYGFDVTLGRNFLLFLTNIGTLNQVTITIPYSNPLVSYEAIQSFQEYSTVNSLIPIQAIVFTSNTLPIQPTNVSPPVVLSNNRIVTTSNNSATANIITDIVSNSGQYAPSVLYMPSAQYRMISLYGNSPLTNIDIQIYCRLRDGSLIPFHLSSGGSVSIKLGFFKKKLN
jgi:hypothetical protein